MKNRLIRVIQASLLSVMLPGIAAIACASGSHEGGHGKKEMDIHWSAPREAVKQVNPVPADSASIALGKKLYLGLCAECHGKNGRGDGSFASSLTTKPTNLQAMSGRHTDGDFAWKITNGRDDMPSWEEELSTSEIWTLVNYIQSLSHHGSTRQTNTHKHSKTK